MLSRRHVGAPLWCYTGQVGPRFGNSGSLVEWKWCHYLMVEAYIHLRPLHISILDIYKGFEPLVCCLMGIWVKPYYCTLAKLAPFMRKSGSLVEWNWCHNVMFEADIHIRPFHTSILDISKVFEPLAYCCNACGCTYTVTLAKVVQDLGTQGHLWSEINAIMSCLRLISTSDCFILIYKILYTKCLSHWYAESKACGCTLMMLHWPSWPKICEFRVVEWKWCPNIMVESDIHLRLIHTSLLDI